MNKFYYTLLIVVCVLFNEDQDSKKEVSAVSKVVSVVGQRPVFTADSLKRAELIVLPDRFKTDDPHKKGEIIVRNNTEERLACGSQFKVERWNGEKWISIAFKRIAFVDMLYFIHAKRDASFDLCLSKCLSDGAKRKGKYRLSKEVWPRHDRKDVFRLYGEFTVE